MNNMKKNMKSTGEMVTISRAEYEAMQADLAQVQQQNQWLMEQLKLNKRKLFGSSSEQLDQLVIEKFGVLFNEAEHWDEASVEPSGERKKSNRKRRSGSIDDAIPEETPVEIVEHRLPEDQQICKICGGRMVVIGKEIRRSLQMKPAEFWVREDHYFTYACKNCEQETGESVVVPTSMEPSVLPGSFASPSAIAHLAVQKYVMYSPLYRMEQEFERQGLKLSRQRR